MTWPGAIILKKGEGMPNYENNLKKGDLYITFDVLFPRGTYDDTEKEGMLNRERICDVLLYRHCCRYNKNIKTRIKSKVIQWTITNTKHYLF